MSHWPAPPFVPKGLRWLAWPFFFLLSLALPNAHAANSAAEIALLIGKGEHHGEASTAWLAASINQELAAGASVKTLENSQMGILLADRTQIRLNQNSEMQIKTVSESAQWTESQIRLNIGRAWSNARPVSAPAGATKPSTVTMETPSATMAIRGTDWLVDVGADGTSQLIVLSGHVVMGNDQGKVEVGPGEAAAAAIGKAPVKLILINPASRIQWVSAWKPQPTRFTGGKAKPYATEVGRIEAGDYSGALAALRPASSRDPVAAILVADLLIYQGEHAEAVEVLSAHVDKGAQDPLAVAMLARALARMDKIAEAEERIAAALPSSPGHTELLLASGELAILQGDPKQATSVYMEVLANDNTNAEAWYGLGLIDSERGNIRKARVNLGQALENNEKMGKATAELAAAETLAGSFATSEKLLMELIEREPENFIAQTALGINRLRSGQPREALEAFLKAGLIEPGYARAWLYTGVAFYQLGERARAMEAFTKASLLDKKDPIPHLYRSMAEADTLDFGTSIGAARQAQERMPYLRSLNQIANNQKGQANLGNSIASFGMEDWASFYANQSDYPYWAGTHLFRADRYTGKFNKNSELYKGYLTDPTVFGASNRYSTIVQIPGHYGRVDAFMERRDWGQGALIGTVNGLVNTPVPLSYFVSGDLSAGEATGEYTRNNSTAHGDNYTIGLGAKPRYDLALFYFTTATKIRADLETSDLLNSHMDQSESRSDLGLNYKWASDNQVWIKVGEGDQNNLITGTYISQPTADWLNRGFRTTIFDKTGHLDRFRSEIKQKDAQIRHTFSTGAFQWTWGLEASRQERAGQQIRTFKPVRVNEDDNFSVKEDDAYITGRYQMLKDLETEIDVYSQNGSIKRLSTIGLDVPGRPLRIPIEDFNQGTDYAEINPRAGLKWRFSPVQSLTVVGQQWRRPASVGTLGAVDTLGIPVNDRLPTAGGYYERARVQYEAEAGNAVFIKVFLDHEYVDNGLGGRRTAISDFEVTQLENLRNRTDVFAPTADIEQTPVFIKGRVRTIGISENVLISERQSFSVRYLWRDAEQTGLSRGLLIPYVPRNYLQLGDHWTFPNRWLLGVTATYRDQRFRDDANLVPLDPGWSFGVSAYWETIDKHSSVQAIVDNLLIDPKSAFLPDPHFVLRYTYRF